MARSHKNQSVFNPSAKLWKRHLFMILRELFLTGFLLKTIVGEIFLSILKCMMSTFPSGHYSSQNDFKFTHFIKGLRQSKPLINTYWPIAWINSFSFMRYEFLSFIIYLIIYYLNFPSPSPVSDLLGPSSQSPHVSRPYIFLTSHRLFS